jgi:hypothetical protein
MSEVKIAEIPVPEGLPKVTVIDDDSITGTSAISILRYMYLAIVVYSITVSYITNCPWYSMILYYVWGYVAFYAWHYSVHHRLRYVPFNKKAYEVHKTHHWKVYPPAEFFGKVGEKVPNQTWMQYFNPKDWVTQHEALLYILMFGMVSISYLFFGVKLSTTIGAIIGYVLMGIVGNYLHHAFHVKDIFLEKYKWFHELRALHYVHHKGSAKQNYGILNMGLDRIIGSFKFNVK